MILLRRHETKKKKLTVKKVQFSPLTILSQKDEGFNRNQDKNASSSTSSGFQKSQILQA